ncbi:MAG TPA: glycosyl hydrolase family 18 protein [Pseudonocardiaceae bacterium]|jgi:chitinase|nr:glycosyl hydrolase family 18 protein [Pseudonocardiaceae bacterium]
MRLSRHSALAVGAAGVLLLAGISVAAGHSAVASQPAASAAGGSGGITVAYYDQWSIYQNAYYLRNLDQSGAANKLDYLIYDFENIDPTNLTCFENTKATDPDPGGESDPNAGDGAEDAFADYQKEFDASTSVNGTADVYNQPIAGNFNQLKELKAEHPNLKILLSIGGWTYSKYFSDVAATAASRQKFVSSCVNMFIDGNLPSEGGFGGNGTAAGIFDGFDIDWEYPGNASGHLGNHYSSADTANYTALLAEFRSELNTAGAANGKTYALSAALPGGQDKIADIQTNQIAQYLTFGDVMTYDMHGAWDATGPTDEQDPLYANPADPNGTVAPGNEQYDINDVINAYINGDSQYGIPGGFPANKLTLGIPFYYRGWTGVPAGNDHGLYQTATGPSPGHTDSGSVPGIAMYKELLGVVDNPEDTFWDPTTESAYFYDGTNFYGGESAQSIQARTDYVHCTGLAGVMMFSMYDLDDPTNTLFNDAVNDLAGTTTSCSGPPSSPPPTSPPPTSPPPTSPPPSGGNLVANSGMESGALSPWTCDAGTGSVVSSPVHSGSHALAAGATSSDDGQCSQTIAVSPGTKYTLSGWVQGNYAYLGDSGTGGTDTNTWTPSAGSWQQLTTSFTTGASTTSVTIYVHGWYGQGTVYADDISVT